MRKALVLLIGLCLALAAPLTALAQATTPPPLQIMDNFKAGTTPSTYKIKEIGPKWLTFSGNTSVQPQSNGIHDIPEYATQGNLTTIGATQYLIAYRIADPGISTAPEDAGLNIPSAIIGNTQLTLCLLDLNTFGSMTNVIMDNPGWETDVNTRRGTDQAGLDRMRRKAKEDLLKTDLKQLRSAIAEFKADMGAYPLMLKDLASPIIPPTTNSGKASPGASYLGPYLTPDVGLANTGVPANPFVAATDTDVLHHWKYNRDDGSVISAVTGVTLDGVQYTAL